MKDKGLDRGLVQDFNTSDRRTKGHFYGFRKMFWDYLNKLHIPFSDACCDTADEAALRTIGFDGTDFKSWNPTNETWETVDVGGSITIETIYASSSGNAFAGGGQGSATQILHPYFLILAVATAGDSVKLPNVTVGAKVTIKNNGANAADVFPSTGDSINGLAANTAIRIAPNSTIVFFATSNTTWEASNEIIGAGDGAVALPSLTFSTQPNMGLYKVSSTEMGISVSGAKSVSVNASGLVTDHITEKTSGFGISLDKPIIRKAGTAKALNTTGAITAAELAGGLITSTTVAGVTGTLPDATSLATQLGATQGTVFEFIVDNSAGANTFTVQVNTGITVGTTALTGGDSLTVSTAQAVGMFRLIFTSATAAILRRIF